MANTLCTVSIGSDPFVDSSILPHVDHGSDHPLVDTPVPPPPPLPPIPVIYRFIDHRSKDHRSVRWSWFHPINSQFFEESYYTGVSLFYQILCIR